MDPLPARTPSEDAPIAYTHDVSLCPICKAQAAPRAENRAFPFCSLRCRQVDLGKWLDEEYRVATMDSAEDPGESSPPTEK
jgi:endogenous inhibitor of DNA gyrase (YacG/DUF329 family)